MEEITTEDIIAAARHALRPDATDTELEHDAPLSLQRLVAGGSLSARSRCDSATGWPSGTPVDTGQRTTLPIGRNVPRFFGES